MQRQFKDKEDHYDRKKACDKNVKFEGETQEVNTMAYHDEPIPRKNKEENQDKRPILIRPIKTHQRMDALMLLTAWTWPNLKITRKMTPNDSSRNVGKARRQINNIEITLLKLNVMCYLIF